MDTGNLIGTSGINFNVKLDQQDFLMVAVYLGVAIIVAGAAIILINRAVR